MNARQIERRIDNLLKEREILIIKKSYWEANKLGAKIADLRFQLENNKELQS